MKMNPQSDGFWTHFWVTITAIFSATGLTTEQWIYVFCAIFGALLSFNSYRNNKRALVNRENEDSKRTEILRSYLAGRKNNTEVDTASVAEEVKDVMNKVGS